MVREPEEAKSEGPFSAKIADWLERADQGIYIATGVAFLLVGCGVFIYSWVTFYLNLDDGFLSAALVLIHDLLLVLIILEIMRTIIAYVKIHTVLLEPFLHIGIIAATRRILTAGAQLTSQTTDVFFQRYLWDTGINAMVIVALGIAVFLFSNVRKAKDLSSQRI
jgi:uncharacterized membrane protein (DUF373 family)